MAIKTFPYNSTEKLSAHFSANEFRCKCGVAHNIKIASELWTFLETLHGVLSASSYGCSAIYVNSGHRCAKHDKNVGGSGYGPHVDGYAADIRALDKNKQPINTKILSCICQDLGFKGIANITSDYTWLHLDMKPRIYYGNEIYGYNTVTSDFYKYYGITEAQIIAICGKSVKANATPVNKKDKPTKTAVYPNKYDAMVRDLQKIFLQKGYNITVDGYAGPKTYEICKKFTIEKGNKGPLVRWVQERLNLLGYDCGIADGAAGVKTMDAIARFQRANGLNSGYLGGTDWIYLLGGKLQ